MFLPVIVISSNHKCKYSLIVLQLTFGRFNIERRTSLHVLENTSQSQVSLVQIISHRESGYSYSKSVIIT